MIQTFALNTQIQRFFTLWFGISIPLVFILLKKEQRLYYFIAASWIIGILFFGFVVPFLDGTIMKALGRMPVEVTFMRILRFIPPLALIFCFWSLAELGRWLHRKNIFKTRKLQGLIILIGIIPVILWVHDNRFMYPQLPSLFRCWEQNQIVCPLTNGQVSKIDFLDNLKEKTPPGSGILAFTGNDRDLSIRYYSLRALVYSNKDGGDTSYSSTEKFLEWSERVQEYNQVADLIKEVSFYRWLEAGGDLGRKYDADYLAVAAPAEIDIESEPIPVNLELVYFNSYAALYRLLP